MRLMRHLSNLSLETLQYRERKASKEIRQMIETGQLQVEPEIREYLRAGWRKRANGQSTSSKNRLSQLTERRSSRGEAFWYDPQTESVIRFLESELEVNRDS